MGRGKLHVCFQLGMLQEEVIARHKPVAQSGVGVEAQSVITTLTPIAEHSLGLSVLDICTGGGGEALGLEAAGFKHGAAVEIDAAACKTLRANRPHWHVIEADLRAIDGRSFRGIDLIAGGVPCPPFSIAGKQLGSDDDRDLFPHALRLISEARPAAILLENVPGFAAARFQSYRDTLLARLGALGYVADWRVLNASDYGAPQLRPRFILVGVRRPFAKAFHWPEVSGPPPTVGEAIGDLMASRGWPGAEQWRQRANRIAPTLVGGSKKHGGPDLGPTRARKQWEQLGVDGLGIANEAPGVAFPLDDLPRLTLEMAARLQTFPTPGASAAGRQRHIVRLAMRSHQSSRKRSGAVSMRRWMARGEAPKLGNTPPIRRPYS